jgi:hypothetical protein
MDMQNRDRQRNQHIKRSFAILKQVLTAFLTMVGIVGAVGVLVYGLLQVALFDKKVYAYFFLALCVGLFGYMMYRLVKRRMLSGILRKVIWFIFVLFIFGGIIALVFLYGSLFVRAPLIAYISAPFVLFSLFYLLPRLNVVQKIRRLLL